MSVATTNLLFIHFPKAAGRWISTNLIESVEGAYYVGDPIYNGHYLPPQANLHPFICARSPVDWLFSLWSHRSRKKGLLGIRTFNWQKRHLLEQVPKKNISFLEFLRYVASKEELLAHYYLDFIHPYSSISIIHQENLQESLHLLLKAHRENFDSKKISDCADKVINPTSRIGHHIKKPDLSDLPENLIDQLLCNNKVFFEITGYEYIDQKFKCPIGFKSLDAVQVSCIKSKLNRNTSHAKHHSSSPLTIGSTNQTKPRSFIVNEIRLFCSPLIALFSDAMNSLRTLVFKLALFLLQLYIRLKYQPVPRPVVSNARYLARDGSLLNIELGGGETPLMKEYGYKNVDIRNLSSVDIVSDVSGLRDHLSPKSVKSIFSRHFLEHLTYSELEDHLKDCHVLLANDGYIEGIIPSMEFHTLQVLLFPPSSSEFLHGLAGFHGWQRGQEYGYWDIHKSSFTHASLLETFDRFGYRLQFVKANVKNIHFIASKIS